MLNLAVAIGLTVLTKDSGGYGTERVILAHPFAGEVVFNPRLFDGQAVALWCWLVENYPVSDSGGCITLAGSPARHWLYRDREGWLEAVTEAALASVRLPFVGVN